MRAIRSAVLGFVGLVAASATAQTVPPDLALQLVTGAVNAPIGVRAPHDGSGRRFVFSQAGSIRIVDAAGTLLPTPFLSVPATFPGSGGTSGLLGLAFHPNYGHPGMPHNDEFYIAYMRAGDCTAPGSCLGSGPDEVLERYTVSADPNVANPTGAVVMRLADNSPPSFHNGGDIHFGPDGYLYMSSGDGGQESGTHWLAECLWKKPNDTTSTSCDNSTTTPQYFLRGKMLRIDVDNRGAIANEEMCGTATGEAAEYSIPADNPFVASTHTCDETYLWGFRNPWRWSFDRQTDDLWLGDVGESSIEEVDRVVRGGNYGWRCLEGTHDSGLDCGTPVGTLLPPIAEYSHEDVGNVVTGGYVYRGTAVPSLVGRYVFTDFGSGRVFAIPNDTQPTMTMTGGFESGLNISSFGEGNDGELYAVNIGGNIQRVTASGGGGGAGVATQLSATGCVSQSDPKQPASGLIPYAPNAAFWSDGAIKERWIGLPNGQNITVGDDGDWDFPNGTVLMKNFRLANRLIETRLFMRHPDGVWAGYTYEWNEQQTDATLVGGGKRVPIGAQTWIYPSEAQCMQCHTEAAGRSLGLETRQLAFNIRYPQTGRDAHQLATLNEIHTLLPPIANPREQVPYPDPTGTSASLGERARAYLHTNCSQCHRPGGPTTSNMDLRFSTTLAATNACDVAPGLGDLGISNARLIAPGAADRSVVPARMNRRGDAEAMPPIGSAQPDANGVTLIRDWINSLASCN